MQFKNSNGKTYEVIAKIGDYAFLQDVNSFQFVVVWCLQKNSWVQGYYFDADRGEQAKGFFNARVGFKAI